MTDAELDHLLLEIAPTKAGYLLANQTVQAIQFLRRRLEEEQAAKEKLRTAADAVIKRWHTPLWKDAPATALFIQDLEAALRESDAEPNAKKKTGPKKR